MFHLLTFEDTNGDGSVEKSEFEQAKTNNKELNPSLIKILEQSFGADANEKITYERLYFLLSCDPVVVDCEWSISEFVAAVKKHYQS